MLTRNLQAKKKVISIIYVYYNVCIVVILEELKRPLLESFKLAIVIKKLMTKPSTVICEQSEKYYMHSYRILYADLIMPKLRHEGCDCLKLRSFQMLSCHQKLFLYFIHLLVWINLNKWADVICFYLICFINHLLWFLNSFTFV